MPRSTTTSWPRRAPRQFLDTYAHMIDLATDGYLREGKRFATLAIGCTGGKHRSVAMAENLAVTTGATSASRSPWSIGTSGASDAARRRRARGSRATSPPGGCRTGRGGPRRWAWPGRHAARPARGDRPAHRDRRHGRRRRVQRPTAPRHGHTTTRRPADGPGSPVRRRRVGPHLELPSSSTGSPPGELAGHAMGNLLITSLWEQTGDVVAGLDWVAALLGRPRAGAAGVQRGGADRRPRCSTRPGPRDQRRAGPVDGGGHRGDRPVDLPGAADPPGTAGGDRGHRRG